VVERASGDGESAQAKAGGWPPELSGVRGRRHGQWYTLAAQLGSDHLNLISDEPNLVLHPDDDHTLEPGEIRRAPVGSVGAVVTPCRSLTSEVPLGAVVVCRHRRVIQECEQFVAIQCK
jgi:hypothetical protein